MDFGGLIKWWDDVKGQLDYWKQLNRNPIYKYCAAQAVITGAKGKLVVSGKSLFLEVWASINISL